MDMKGCSITELKRLYKFVKIASSVAQDNYPELLGKMFVINAPMLFSIVWAIAKNFVDIKTQKKISILGSKYKKQLAKMIDIDVLPDFLGGKVKIDFESGEWEKINIGPWNNP